MRVSSARRKLLCESEGGDGALVHPKQMHAAPVEGRLWPSLRTLRAGWNRRRSRASRWTCWKAPAPTVRESCCRLLGGFLGGRIDVALGTHSKHLSKMGSTPSIESSSRSKDCSVVGGKPGVRHLVDFGDCATILDGDGRFETFARSVTAATRALWRVRIALVPLEGRAKPTRQVARADRIAATNRCRPSGYFRGRDDSARFRRSGQPFRRHLGKACPGEVDHFPVRFMSAIRSVGAIGILESVESTRDLGRSADKIVLKVRLHDQCAPRHHKTTGRSGTVRPSRTCGTSASKGSRRGDLDLLAADLLAAAERHPALREHAGVQAVVGCIRLTRITMARLGCSCIDLGDGFADGLRIARLLRTATISVMAQARRTPAEPFC